MTLDELRAQLSPCPFCGDDGQSFETTCVIERRHSPYMSGPGALINVSIAHWCPRIDGGAHTNSRKVTGRDHETALKEWNRRP